MKRACATCRYWEKEGENDPGYGECRRYPPRNEGAMREPGLPVAEFPVVCAADWCGEYVPLKSGGRP